jgi:hypothetical protein
VSLSEQGMCSSVGRLGEWYRLGGKGRGRGIRPRGENYLDKV